MAGKKRPAATRSPSPDSAERPARFHFPSVRRGQPLVDTYTYHSVDPVDSQDKGKQREDAITAEVAGEWMLGVDEAGRGPALGKARGRRARRLRNRSKA